MTARFANDQRRPERQPRLHAPALPGGSPGCAALNEGRSVNPGYTQLAVIVATRVRPRSTKAGASTPATRTRSSWPWGSSRPLNEGRSVNPGYTNARDPISTPRGTAQRRPERQPRLHGRRHAESEQEPERSTKAGASTPATPEYEKQDLVPRGTAQRRPERQPRLHMAPRKAPTSVGPAQRRPERQPRLHPARRDCCDTCPATLNEGRSVNPGYTTASSSSCTPASIAQRRPERQPRLHAASWTPSALTVFAQRRPERQPRLHPPTSPVTWK